MSPPPPLPFPSLGAAAPRPLLSAWAPRPQAPDGLGQAGWVGEGCRPGPRVGLDGLVLKRRRTGCCSRPRPRTADGLLQPARAFGPGRLRGVRSC
ncbi:hypothetical protein E0E62_02775 [Streptomyces sp. 16-176A]